MPLMLPLALTLFASCSSVKVVDADIPPLPHLEEVPKGKPLNEREAILERNYILLGLWAEKVIRFNE